DTAHRLLDELRQAVPIIRHPGRRTSPPELDELEHWPLSDARLESLRRREGCAEFATLGRGNHFLEFQADDEDRLWILVHSGSRAMGPAIRDFHLERAEGAGSSGLRALDANSLQGRAYLPDV